MQLISTIEQVQTVVDMYSFTHLPITLSCDGDDDFVIITGILSTFDVEKTEKVDCKVYTRTEIGLPTCIDILIRDIEDTVRRMWMHELDESFKLLNKHVRKPHPKLEETINYGRERDSRAAEITKGLE